MSLDRLTISGFRNLHPTELIPGPGINWLTGPNGAGKTSLLEAIHVLARGRSFRSNQISAVIQHGADQLMVVARRRTDGRRLGVERGAEGWRGRIDGRDSQRISEFAAALPLVLFEPESHQLIAGGPYLRRQYLDWTLFHVEQAYVETWQRYARLLKQRNAALKSGATPALLDALDTPMSVAGERLGELRKTLVEELSRRVPELAEALGLRLPGAPGLRYRPGHPPEMSLLEGLRSQRQQDLERGFTQRGPHRAELVLLSGSHSAGQELSRGQQKLYAMLLLLSQLQMLSNVAAHPPLLLLDDPVSELDQPHFQQVASWLEQQDIQCWITATTAPPPGVEVFHVEQGRLVQDGIMPRV